MLLEQTVTVVFNIPNVLSDVIKWFKFHAFCFALNELLNLMTSWSFAFIHKLAADYKNVLPISTNMMCKYSRCKWRMCCVGRDYPDFFEKLYSLLDISLLHVKHMAKFFTLLDLFLSSRWYNNTRKIWPRSVLWVKRH